MVSDRPHDLKLIACLQYFEATDKKADIQATEDSEGPTCCRVIPDNTLSERHRPCSDGISEGALHVVSPEAGFNWLHLNAPNHIESASIPNHFERRPSFTASGGTASAFGRGTLGGGHQQASERNVILRSEERSEVTFTDFI
ncbi:hypothetical protein Bbelb_071650 [Branchiostoma belcheri]|nr:hypothetical protein Bbelb_071650 [Branchiostoma belcheri]